MIKLYCIRDMKYTGRELFLTCTGIMIGIFINNKGDMTWQQERAMKVWDEKRLGSVMATRSFERVQKREEEKRYWCYKGISVTGSHQDTTNSILFSHMYKENRKTDDMVTSGDKLSWPHYPVTFEGLLLSNPSYDEPKMQLAVADALKKGDLIENPSGYYQSIN